MKTLTQGSTMKQKKNLPPPQFFDANVRRYILRSYSVDVGIERARQAGIIAINAAGIWLEDHEGRIRKLERWRKEVDPWRDRVQSKVKLSGRRKKIVSE